MTAHVEGFTIPKQHEHYWKSIEGGFWFKNAYDLLLDALPADRPSVWVEVGVLYGMSIAYLGIEIANRGLPCTLHAVDNFMGWPGVDQGEALREKFTFNTIKVAEALGDRFKVHPFGSTEVASSFLDGTCDVVWLDADHTHEAVTNDIAAWWPKVRVGGHLGGDDWAYPGVRMATMEAFPNAVDVGSGERFSAPWPWWLVERTAG